jgi:hypothetical protein
MASGQYMWRFAVERDAGDGAAAKLLNDLMGDVGFGLGGQHLACRV